MLSDRWRGSGNTQQMGGGGVYLYGRSVFVLHVPRCSLQPEQIAMVNFEGKRGLNLWQKRHNFTRTYVLSAAGTHGNGPCIAGKP